MKLHTLFLRTLPFFLLFISCGNTENNKRIIGKWAGSEWLANGQPSDYNVQSTFFTFKDKGDYTFEYAGNIEEGTYKVENDMLFTTPAGQDEMMVKINKLTSDSLVFEMNRSGRIELLTLLRK